MPTVQPRLTTAIAESGRTQNLDLPIRAPRHKAAEWVTRHFFKISPRILERWPLTCRRINGKAHCETDELFAEARSRVAEAPEVRGGSAAAPSDAAEAFASRADELAQIA